MRRTLTVCRSGLSAAAALVLLTACGSSEGKESAASESSASSSSAAGTSAGESNSEFCTQAAGVQEQLSSTFDGGSDPNSLPPALRDAADTVRSIEPPAALKSDWTTFADGIEQVAAAAQGDLNDPNVVAALQQRLEGLQQEFGTAFTNVDTYLRDECGIAPAGTDPAAPTG
jgi:hypothetical protein